MTQPGEPLCLNLTVPSRAEPVPFFHYAASRPHIIGIFEGRTYPPIPDVGTVATIVDIGANVGAASIMLAAQHPHAAVHAYEPGPGARALLVRNAATFPQIRVHPFGLGNGNRQHRLYRSRWDPMSASVLQSAENTDEFDLIEIRQAGPALEAACVSSVDILKIDTEGCELPILRELAQVVPEVKILYLEYHSDADRREIDRLLTPTHVLAFASVAHPHRGDVCYVQRNTEYARRHDHFAIGDKPADAL